jgi:hypothetical protein
MTTPNSCKRPVLRNLESRRQKTPARNSQTPRKSRTGKSKKTQTLTDNQTTLREEIIETAESIDIPAEVIPELLTKQTPMMASGMNVKIVTFQGQPGSKGETWLKEYTSICKVLYNFNDEKVKLTFPFHLTGQAQAWYQSLPDETKDNKDNLVEAFKKRFDGSDGGYTLNAVRQEPNETVCDYTTRFYNLTHDKNMPDSWLISKYVDGLTPSIKRIVKPQELLSLDIARRAAIRAEQSELDTVQVSVVSENSHSSAVEAKLDTLIKLMTHQSTVNQSRQEPVQYHQDPPQTWSRRKQNRDYHSQQGRNMNNISRKVNSHFCKICSKTGHFEQHCPEIESFKSFQEARKPSNQNQ